MQEGGGKVGSLHEEKEGRKLQEISESKMKERWKGGERERRREREVVCKFRCKNIRPSQVPVAAAAKVYFHIAWLSQTY